VDGEIDSPSGLFGFSHFFTQGAATLALGLGYKRLSGSAVKPCV